MDRKKNLLPFLPHALCAVASLFLLCSCATPGPQNPEATVGPDRAEMGKRTEINSELTKVFGPINEKSELLESE